VFTKNSNVIIKSVESTTNPGDVSALVVSFKSLPEGTYEDEILINIEDQSLIKIPVSFTIGQASIQNLDKKPMRAMYLAHNQRIYINNPPQNIQGVEIWNSKGQQVLNDISHTLDDIYFKNASSGIYFVLIKTKTGAVASKVIVH
jgi:hypothetical protein